MRDQTPHRGIRRWRRSRAWAGGGLVLLLVPSGCTQSPDAWEGARRIDLAEFASPDSPPARPRRAAAETVVVVELDAPEVGSGAALVEGDRTWVDSLVGQVNGRPIYANEFFSPIGDRLRAAGREVTTRQFALEVAPEIILGRLRQVVLDELFLAEAESNLTQEQQLGLGAWLRQVRESVISSRGGGSRSATEARLQAEEGVSVDEYVGQLKDRALIGQLQRDRIDARVFVSWRDVEREYERRYEEFNPPSLASFLRIRIPTEQTQLVSDVTRRVREEPFAMVAEDVGMPDDGAWDSFEIGPEGLADLEMSEAIKSQLVDLELGQTSEPFEVGRSTWWLHLALIERPTARSIFEPTVQRQLTNEIRARRQNEEQMRFIDSLLEDGIYDELNVMAERLLAIAVVRYAAE